MHLRLMSRPVLTHFPNDLLGEPREDQLQGPDGQKVIEIAGRTCYDSFGKGRDSDAYAQHILETTHGSVLEHAYYVFFISGVSRGLTHELVRHRVGVSISQRSTRYVDENESEWMLHPLEEKFMQEGGAFMHSRESLIKQAQELYKDRVEKLQKWMQDKGISAIQARKQARGAARGYLGNALATELTWGANVRSLIHFVTMRGSEAADAEIRELAVKLLEIMKQEIPVYFKGFEVYPSSDGIGQAIRAPFNRGV